MRFVLASGSPRRREILESVFGEVEIFPPHIDESIIPGEAPEDYVTRIVNEKMDAVSRKSEGDVIILTSDTIVTIDGKILGKPASAEEASSMLRLLSGREHRVITGLCILHGGYNSYRETAYDVSYVLFKKIDEIMIGRYLDLINYKDKAGSYAVQEYGEMIIDSIKGSVTNVIGLPLGLLFEMMGRTGISSSFF